MKTLQQNTEYKTIGLGWYGLCHEEDGYICEDFTLEQSNEQVQKIDHVYEVSGDDSSRAVFYSTYANHVHGDDVVNSLTSLKCGRAYYVVLKKGNEELDIPGFFFTDSKTRSCVLAFASFNVKFSLALKSTVFLLIRWHVCFQYLR